MKPARSAPPLLFAQVAHRRLERHPRARVQAALVFVMPWNPRQEPAGEPEDLGDHRAVLGQQRDIPRHPVRVGPNDPTVAVEDGWPMSRLREEQMVRSTDVVNPIDRHRDQILARSLVDRCDEALERAVEQHRMKVIALCVKAFGQLQTGQHLTTWCGAASGRAGTSNRNAGRVWPVRHRARRARPRRISRRRSSSMSTFSGMRPDEYTFARAQSTGSLPVLSR